MTADPSRVKPVGVECVGVTLAFALDATQYSKMSSVACVGFVGVNDPVVPKTAVPDALTTGVAI